MTTELVTADIGGTHARFALACVAGDGAISLDDPVTLSTRDYASFETAWAAFARHVDRALPQAAAIAIAGPVSGDMIRFTNNPWIIRPALIRDLLAVEQFTLINDFGAVGHAVARAAESDFAHICGPEVPLPAEGTISILGPGTGLGVAYVWRGQGSYRVQPTEGGHIDFAPLDRIEDAIVAHLRHCHGRVSVERVVSGPAIVDIYEALAALENRPIRQADDRTVWDMGIGGADPLAVAAVDRFCLSLGAVAGDIALVQGAAGVVIAGGLGLRLHKTLLRSGFASRFRAKGRFENLMAALPVKLITHPQPGLFGAAAAFAKEHLS